MKKLRVLNLSPTEEILLKYFKSYNYFSVLQMTTPIFESYYKCFPEIRKKSFSNIDIIICNINTFKDFNILSSYFCSSSYILFPNISRFILHSKPIAFIILEPSNYISSTHYDEFKNTFSIFNYQIIEISIIHDSQNLTLIIGTTFQLPAFAHIKRKKNKQVTIFDILDMLTLNI